MLKKVVGHKTLGDHLIFESGWDTLLIKAKLAQVGTFFPARISALACKMGQIKKNKATTL